jgi:LPS-assembly lipoprotein
MLLKRRALCIFALTTAVALSGCGFQLRGSNGQARIPFKTIYLNIPESSPLGNELKRYIRATGTEVETEAKQAEASMQLLSEVRDKVVRALDSKGRIREYTLNYRISIQMTDKDGKILMPPTAIAVKRDISFNESQVMAKEQEEALLYRDMQSDLVQQILRRLSALKPA